MTAIDAITNTARQMIIARAIIRSGTRFGVSDGFKSGIAARGIGHLEMYHATSKVYLVSYGDCRHYLLSGCVARVARQIIREGIRQ